MASTGKDLLPGSRIREYEILEIIGKGGMGAVYRARHVYLDEERAIKVIQTRLAGDKDFIDRFIREAKILTRLHHPNLVQLYEFGTLEEGVFFMVLEFLHGESVLERIHRKKRIPIQESIQIIRQAALGLNDAHKKGIIHRDISPDNLLLVKDESGAEITKVIDFGIAKPHFDSTQHLTATSHFIGKPEYCSPEQSGLLEEGEMIDRRSDIYSLGVTLYYMLAGRLPFHAGTLQGYLLKHATELPKPISSHFQPGEFPNALEGVVMKTLAKRREERYATMEEFVHALDQITSAEIVEPTLITATTLPVPTELHPGDIFARRYMIEKKLGEGGMGSVYKAIDRILEIAVALKVMSAKVIDNPKTIERFKREVILARRVAHPNACRIYDIGESAGIHYVSMEYLQGRTLAEMLSREGVLPPDIGIPIIRQVLLALQEAHRVGVIHRDLKPQNIMVDLNLRASIMDFGISISADVSRVTQTGVLIGTPYYMSPEQLEGSNIDLRADLYSMGVIMFQIFTGRLPFVAESPMAIIVAHLKSTPPKPSELIPGFPGELERIILKALEKEPANRYRDARELLSDLEQLYPDASSSSVISREALADKLIAERSYSKAIKFLRAMLKGNPEKTQWKKLLRIAISEKSKRDLRRARSLIRKKNLIQAQLLIERINKLHPEDNKIISQLRKMESLLNSERNHAVEEFLQEAEGLLLEKDWNAALSRLEAASNLRSDDPRIAQLEERLHILQHRELQTRLDAIKQLAESAESAPAQEALAAYEQALARAEELVQEDPGLELAVSLRDQIKQWLAVATEKESTKKELGLALEPLNVQNPDLAVSLLKKMQSGISDPQIHESIGGILARMQQIASAFSRKDLKSISSLIQDLLNNDPQGWLEPHRHLFSRLKDHARQLEARQREFQAAFDEGEDFFGRRKWEQAIESWKRALQIMPGEPSVSQWISSAESRLQTELEMRAQVDSQLSQCEPLILEKRFDTVSEILGRTSKAISEYHLKGFEEAISSIQKHVREEKGRAELIARNLAKASSLYQGQEYQKALSKIDELLTMDPSLQEGQRLKRDIEQAIRRKEKADAAYRDAMDNARLFYEQRKWMEAGESSKRALQIVPKDPEAEQWLSRAETRLSEETRLQAFLSSRLKECEREINSRNYDSAKQILDEARQKISLEYRLDDLTGLYNALKTRLDEEIAIENDRRKTIDIAISAATSFFNQGALQEALDTVNVLLNKEPLLDQAVTLKQQIQSSLQQKEQTERKLAEIFQRGMASYKNLQWSQAIDSWKKAVEVAPQEENARQWLVKAEKRLEEERQLRGRIAGALQEASRFVNSNNYEEARSILSEIQPLFSPKYLLQDLGEEMRELGERLERGIATENARREEIQTILSETRSLYERGDLAGAQARVQALLQKEPELPAARKLEEDVESAVRQRAAMEERVEIAVHELVDLLVQEQFDALAPALRKLQQAAEGSEYAKDTSALSEDLDFIANAVMSGNMGEARNTIGSLSGKFKLLEPYGESFRGLMQKLQERQEKEAAFGRYFHQGVQSIHARRWEDAVDCLQKADAIYRDRPQVREFLSAAKAKAARQSELGVKIRRGMKDIAEGSKSKRWDDVISLCNGLLQEDTAEYPSFHSDLEEIRNAFAAAQHSRTIETLRKANKLLKAGKYAEARSAFQKVLTWEPGNNTAAEGIVGIDAKETKAVAETVPRIPSAETREAPTRAVPTTLAPSDRSRAIVTAAILTVLLGASGLWLYLSARKPEPTTGTVHGTTTSIGSRTTTTGPTPVMPVVSVLINALPWGHIRIIPVSEGLNVAEFSPQELTTPCILPLQEGSYDLEVTNNLLAKPLVKRIIVQSGQTNEFTVDAYGSYTVDTIISQVQQKR